MHKKKTNYSTYPSLFSFLSFVIKIIILIDSPFFSLSLTYQFNFVYFFSSFPTHPFPYFIMYQQQQHYDYEPSSYRQHDAYAMNDMTHSRPYYEETKAVPATTDGYYNYAAPTTRNSQVAAASSEKFSRRNNKENRSCCDKICCGCCTCCPRWCRWCSCIILLIIVALGIAVGVLAAIFKVPKIEFTGIQGTPAFGMQGLTTVNLNISLGFTVDNPNIESVTFTTLAATVSLYLSRYYICI